MNNIDLYKLKYSKYKSKYLELKQKNLEGGLLPKMTGNVCFWIDSVKFDEKYICKKNIFTDMRSNIPYEWKIYKKEDNKDKKEEVNLTFDNLCEMSFLVIPFPEEKDYKPEEPKKWIIPTKGGVFSSWKEKKCVPPILKDKFDEFMRNNDTRAALKKQKRINEKQEIEKKFGLKLTKINTMNDNLDKKTEVTKYNNELKEDKNGFNKKIIDEDNEEHNKKLKELFLLAKSCIETQPSIVYCIEFKINRFGHNEVLEYEVLTF